MSKPKVCPKCKLEWTYVPGYSEDQNICYRCLSNPPKQERIRLIERALRECGRDVTHAAVAAQYKRETSETLPPPEQEMQWEK